MEDRTNTIAGWVLFCGVIALALSIGSGMYYHADSPERPEQLGYAVEVAEAEGGESGPSLAELLATGSAAAGENVFAKCVACHTINQGGANGTGPNLWATMGKPHAHVAGFAYSSALKEVPGNWTWEAMDAWLKSPRGYANGTKMSFAGLGKAEDRANVMLYLAENGGGPPLPEFVPEAEGEEGGEAVEGEEGAEAAEGVDGAAPSEAQAAGALGGPEATAASRTGAGGGAPN